jgi:hypothetical protein
MSSSIIFIDIEFFTRPFALVTYKLNPQDICFVCCFLLTLQGKAEKLVAVEMQEPTPYSALNLSWIACSIPLYSLWGGPTGWAQKSSFLFYFIFGLIWRDQASD